MCFFLQSQIWHEETESTIDRLHQTSSRVSAAIDEAAKVQEVVVERQKASLEYQRQLAANGSMLSQALDASKANIRTMLSEFKSSTDEQKVIMRFLFLDSEKMHSNLTLSISDLDF
jgi:multidrug resistance efflux pump